MSSQFQGKRILTPDWEGMTRATISETMRSIADRFRKWHDDRQTWAALRHLDDHQLKELRIYPRPAELTKPEFP
jgi:uncharacterized protein YjiS (DUF1127 family)